MKGKDPRKSKKLLATAYHEAGHGVAAFLMKIRFSRLSIIEDEDSEGRMTGCRWTSKFNPEYDDRKILRRRVEARIILLLAGCVAGMIFASVKKRRSAGADFH